MKNSHGIILDDYYELWTIFDWVETTINNRDACIVYPIETICQVGGEDRFATIYS